MKTAILVTGQYRKQVYDHHTLIPRMLKIFDCDIFFHTWDNHVNLVPFKWKDRLFSSPEPEMNYHPIDDNPLNMKHKKWETYRSKKLLQDKTRHANKQLLAYSNLINRIPEEYDMCIRVRWDVFVSDKVDFRPYLEMSYNEGAVGFMVRPARGQSVDQLLELTKDPAKSLRNGEDKDNFWDDDWYGYVPDCMIFHRRDHFNTDLVKELHAKKSLAPAEWGWYQILSEPFGDIHTSVHGGAMIMR